MTGAIIAVGGLLLIAVTVDLVREFRRPAPPSYIERIERFENARSDAERREERKLWLPR